jgi:hypothetical protein
MDEINSEILQQFETKGLIINEAIAVDARLVKSARRPITHQKLKELKENSNTPEGKLNRCARRIKSGLNA